MNLESTAPGSFAETLLTTFIATFMKAAILHIEKRLKLA